MIRQSSNAEVIPHPPIVMEEVTDPEELARSRAQWEQLQQNSDWFNTHAEAVYREHRGKHICIAGQELFVGESVRDAIKQAQAAHPDDKGFFFLYVPLKIMSRVYANSR